VAPLVATEHYQIWQLRPGVAVYRADVAESWRVVMVTRSEVRLSAADGSFPELDLTKGDTVVVPAACVRGLIVTGDSDSEALLVGP
jgi:uncharacterized protein YjlB